MNAEVAFATKWPLRMFAILLVLIGLVLAVGGGRLVQLGGSPYYVVTGMIAVVSGILLWRCRISGAVAYGILFFSTIAWALWEVGLNGWYLMPRVAGPLVLGLIFLIPIVRRPLAAGPDRWPCIRILGALLLAIGVGMVLHITVPPTIPPDPIYQAGQGSAPAPQHLAAEDANKGDWLHYGKDVGASRFSNLTQINIENVSELKVAWKIRLGGPDYAYALATTPLKIGDTLYLCSSKNNIFALDAETGEQHWHFESGIDVTGHPMPNCRGVAYYKVPDAEGLCADRIITNTIDARLIALDAREGKPCPEFGIDGQVSLLTGMGDVQNRYYFATSAPTIVRGNIVLGGFVLDNQYWGEPSGVIRGFDAVTGELAWAWDMAHPDWEGLPPEGEHYTRSSPNAWAPMSGDEEAGLVFVPLGNPTPDYFGGHRRPFDEKYGSSLVALDASTGRPRWSFQTVHHDLWDYDNPSAPTTVDLPTADGIIPALVQPTKTGFLFVLNRLTGEPIYPAKELPVPQKGAVPEEWLSPTQPFSVGLPSFRGPDLTEASMWGVTPLDQLWCRIKFKEARYEGIYTPPGLTPAITRPSIYGGMNWGGVAVDRTRNVAIVNALHVSNYIRLITREEADELGLKPIGQGRSAKHGLSSAQEGLPYAVKTGPFVSPFGIPCTNPPYGTISAVDLTTGRLVWTQPLGTAEQAGPLGIASHLPFTIGAPNLGGAAVTGSGLAFIGASQDRYIRAFDTATGQELWKAGLPAGGHATPVTYISPESGRQFVVISAGGNLGMGPHVADYLVAFALPKEKTP